MGCCCQFQVLDRMVAVTKYFVVVVRGCVTQLSPGMNESFLAWSGLSRARHSNDDVM
jgi:hypothetical protein